MTKNGEVSLAQVASTILEDALHNIIHSIVVETHREHKMMLASLDPNTRLPHCETCKLPRLLDPPLAPKVRGTTNDPPSNTNYCDRKPWSRRPGHDIYGNPFLKSDVTGRPMTKKEREAAAKNSKADGNDEGGGDNAPGSPGQEDNNPTSNPAKLEKGEKKASKIDEKLKKGEYVPWQTCPSCKRSLLITRFAKHLEQCMGLSGRAASRNAMAKMNNGNTPSGSRGGTPKPDKDDDDDDDDLALASIKGSGGGGSGGGVRKKLLKKGLKDKAKKEGVGGGGGATPTNGKIPKSLSSTSKANGSNTLRSSPAPSSSAGEGGKRDRVVDDDDEDEVHVKKRQKLQRVGSTTSLLSQSTATAAEMERGDSNDGSYVADNNSFVDD